MQKEVFDFTFTPDVARGAPPPPEAGGRKVRSVPPAAGANYFTMYTQFTSIPTQPLTLRDLLYIYTDATRRPYIHVLPDTTRDLLYDLQCDLAFGWAGFPGS